MEHEVDGDANYNWSAWNDPQRGLEELEIGGRVETILTIALLR